jgi:tetratricopeptide (TPR) repeat protein
VTATGGAADAPPDAGRTVGRDAADAGQAALAEVGPATSPSARAAAITRAWTVVEATLQAAVPQGTDAAADRQSGQGLVRALRQRDIVSLDQGHALLDLLAVTERGRQPEYEPTDADVVGAREAVARLATASGSRPVGAVLVPGGVPPAADGAGRDGSAASTVPTVVATGPPAMTAPVRGRRSTSVIVGGLLGLVLVIGAIAFFVMAHGDADITRALPWTPSARARGVTAYEAGHLDDARVALREAEAADSSDPVAHLYLGRIARETGDLPTARAELTTAVRLAPTNAEAEREMGAYLLAARQPELARRFYVRAVGLDPRDRSAQGWLACALVRVGQRATAGRFLQRAGPGAWSACIADSVSVIAPTGPSAPAIR